MRVGRMDFARGKICNPPFSSDRRGNVVETSPLDDSRSAHFFVQRCTGCEMQQRRRHWRRQPWRTRHLWATSASASMSLSRLRQFRAHTHSLPRPQRGLRMMRRRGGQLIVLAGCWSGLNKEHSNTPFRFLSFTRVHVDLPASEEAHSNTGRDKSKVQNAQIAT